MFTEMILERFRTASLLFTSAGQVYSADLYRFAWICNLNQKLYNNSEQYNITAQAGVTPVMVASRRGQRDVVKVLLSHGADVSMVGLKVIH